MNDIFVVVEHRGGVIRDITFELLHQGRKLARESSGRTTAVFLGGGIGHLVPQLSSRADRVLVLDDERFAYFDGRVIQAGLFHLLQEYRPLLTLIGQTSWGLDLAPGLAVKTGYPLSTDCVDIGLENGRPHALRQIYAGKVFCRVSFPEAPGYLLTVRPGAFPAAAPETLPGEVLSPVIPAGLPAPGKQFLEFIESEAGEVDIAQAEFLVSVGRGVGEEENLPQVKELARSLGAALSCSRPVVDKKWLPKYHQVGTSGKTVKPRVYLALGISGAFQHLAGISGAGTVIAINKDPKAPIFRAAHYGVAEDMFKIIPALLEKLE
ncbi:MAG: electron transfer flavoprotein subunit alpha/FixB family protein [Deltaproteobacteria bacterium]|nr:electron transfer flavoprotein subunit alpha/FixB family protein [Deltaproteobacteria bacterium]